MNNDVEQLLGQLTPRGVRPELRSQVLAGVAAALQTEPASPWLRRSALAVAASILLGVGMNFWVHEASERRLAQIFGPPPVSKAAMAVANAIGEITDEPTAQWVYQRLAVRCESRNGPAEYAKYCDILKQLIDEMSLSKDSYHETPEKDPEMDRSRPRRAGGDRSGCQRRVYLDYRRTA